jgi:ribose transport system permease protein
MDDVRRKRTFTGTGQVVSLAVVLILLFLLFSICTDSFFSGPNLINIARQVSFVGIAAIGATMVLLIGGIDLSIGSLVALTGVSAASLMVNTAIPPFVCMLIGILVGTVGGVVNGLVITRLKIPALITTLATLTIYRGISYTSVGGLPVFGLPKGTFLWFEEGVMAIGKGYIWIIPVPVILMAICFALGWIFLYRTYMGRFIYALGGNEEAARLSGIKTDRVQMIVYAIAGTLAGLTGMMIMARVNSGQPSVAAGFELEVITAVVLGGVSISGGRGSLWGVLLGVIIIGVLNNGLIIMNISEYNQLVIRGLVLLIAVGMDQLRLRMAG